MTNSVAFSNQLLEGARNCVLECGGVSEGMNVLILNLINDKSNPVDDLAVHALATICQEVGAKPQILWATGMEKGWWDDPSPIVLGAFRESDLVINNTVSIGRPLRAVREIMFGKGVPQIRNMASTVEVLSSPWARIPFALTDEIIRTAGARLDGASSWRVVSPNGTDIAGTFAPPSATQSGISKYATRRKDTKNRPFPQGCLTPVTSVGANGVIVTDRMPPWEARHVGAGEVSFEQPLRVTIENNRMVNFEGGPEAEKFRKFFAQMAGHIGEDAWNLAPSTPGSTPRPASTSPRRATRTCGTDASTTTRPSCTSTWVGRSRPRSTTTHTCSASPARSTSRRSTSTATSSTTVGDSPCWKTRTFSRWRASTATRTTC